jgi:DNA-directed RNA polymerase specialized sigma24 family protein
VVLEWLERVPIEDIAKHLGIMPYRAKNLLKRAKRRMLDDNEDDD